ncbi:hypothetical protein [Shewanella mangrovisoli]|uniref:hypothetical protein n=1 Tax=Shewanella mangrovisoli TaxID=2864211 RepID=UPI001C65D1DC|nr:hypothetical protein [Shewanella mangrovisoli]QYK07582.1 hypothetical protein K0H60_12100 [Shewanella mangrovisoli]
MLKITKLILSSIWVLVMVFSLSNCATPEVHTDVALVSYDSDTKYGVEDRSDGFQITVYYSRYQFIPESDAVATACKSQLTAIAWEYSDKQGKEIEPINEQRIRISMGRNGFSGITSCRADVITKWKSLK